MSDNDDYDDSNDQQVSTGNDNQVSSGSSNGSVPPGANKYYHSKTEDVQEHETDSSYDYESHTKEYTYYEGNN